MSPSPRPRSATGMRGVIAMLVIVLGLSGCSADAAAGPPPTPAASGTPTASEQPTPDPQESASRAPEPSGLAERLADAISSGDTAALERYVSEPTRVVIAASEADVRYSAVDAVLALDYVHPGVGVWDFDLSPAVLAGFAAHPAYAEFFPEDAVVGRSDSGAVVSFVPNGELVGTIFMAMHESLIAEY